MFYHSLVKYFAAALLIFRISQSQEIQGRVNLGADPSSPSTESFIFSLNVDSGILPLYFDLYNVTDGSTVDPVDPGVFDEDVMVSCVTSTIFTPGDSVVNVISTVVPLRNGDTVAQVSFDIVSQGRRVELQCNGQTALAPPGTTSYFSPETSAGRTGFLTVKKSPVVSLDDCSDAILVANTDGRKQITVRLSEPVQDFNVTVRCEVVGVSPDNTFVWIRFDMFEDVRIETGKDTAEMIYTINGGGNALRVNCSATSDDGTQFQTASSTSDILFDFETGSVQITPATSNVNSDRFTPLLVLSEPLQTGEAEVIFFCNLTPLNSTEEAEGIIRECVAPEDAVGTTSVPVTDGSTVTGSNPTGLISLATQLPTAGLQTLPPPTAAPSDNGTAVWELVNSQINFQPEDVQKSLRLRLNNPGLGYRGVLLVRCCATPELNTNPKYMGLSASALAIVDVAVARTINWTEATVSSDLQTELTIGNPAYTEVSPCPCDLTANTCDVNCCCDEMCLEEDIMTFTCLTGIQGGNFTRIDEFNCYSPDHIFRSDVSPFVCVETDNSPYLGLHFTARPGAHDAAAYNTLKASVSSKSLTSFEDSSRRALEFENAEALGGGYKYGFPVETLFEETNTRGILSLPQADPQGGCSWLSPIRFQTDASSMCPAIPQESLCSESSVLSARAFVLSTNIGYPPCPEAPGILTSYGGSTPAPATVRYYCTDDITPYLVSRTELSQLLLPKGVSLFPENVTSDDAIPLPDRCDWDDGYTVPLIPIYENSTYLCSNSVLDVRYEIFWRGNQIVQVDAAVILGTVSLTPIGSMASTDTEKTATFVTPPPTLPPPDDPTTATMLVTEDEFITFYENTTGFETTQMPVTMDTISTTAAYVQTTEDLTTQPLTTTQGSTTPWDVTTDSEVTTGPPMTTDSEVTTGPPMITDSYVNISQVPNTPLEFTQRFRVQFTHLADPSTDPDPIDPPQAGNQVTRSGNPGYITGRSVLSGLAVSSPLVECNETGQCAPVEPIQPGEFIEIDDAEANRLRVWVPGPASLCAQSSLADVTFGEDHISGCVLRLGWTQLSNCSMLRDTLLTELQSIAAADRIGKVGNANTTIQTDWAQVFSSENGFLSTDVPTTAMTTEAMTTEVMTTDFMTANSSNETLPRPLDFLQGVCYNVPTAVNVEILYDDVGEVEGVIQREILAARVTFSKSTVRLQCIGAIGIACQPEQNANETIDWVQSFPITSTVTFTPAYNNRNPYLCGFDMCDEEYIYPLTSRFYGDPRQYSMALAVFVALLFITYVAITKPCP